MATKPKTDHDHDEEQAGIDVPETITPDSVLYWNMGLALGVWAVLLVILVLLTRPFTGTFIPGKYNMLFAGAFTLFIVGMLTKNGTIAVNIPDWHGVTTFNQFTRERRAIFAGFHWKAWCEKLDEVLTSLKRETHGNPTIKCPTKDRVMVMLQELYIHVRNDTSKKTFEQDQLLLIRNRSIEPHALQELVEARVVQMFKAYASGKTVQQLANVIEVQEAVVGEGTANHDELHQMAEHWGIHIGAELKGSEPDEATKKLMATPTLAESLRKAIAILMKADKDGNTMGFDEAREAALLLDDTAEFSAGSWKLGVSGIPNARDISVVVGALPGKTAKPNPKSRGGKK